MKSIVVCIKQVPDSAEVRIDPKTGTLIREGVPSIVNPYDMHAVEAAIVLKEQNPGSKVTAITMGPPQAEAALREVISMGVDEGVLVSDRAFAGADTWATAYALSKAITKIGADIILCGKQAIDGDTAQVGPEVAAFLDMPHVAYVRKIHGLEEGGKIKIERMMDEGYDLIEAELPVLMTVVKELNKPRLPSLKGKMKAKSAKIPAWKASDIGAEESLSGLKGSPTQVKNIFTPQIQKEKVMLQGSPEEQAGAIVKILKELKCL